MDDFLFGVGLFVLACLLIGGTAIGATYGIARPTCYAQWADSGMQVRWSFFGDCQLRQTNGMWITDEAYTAMNKDVNMK